MKPYIFTGLTWNTVFMTAPHFFLSLQHQAEYSRAQVDELFDLIWKHLCFACVQPAFKSHRGLWSTCTLHCGLLSQYRVTQTEEQPTDTRNNTWHLCVFHQLSSAAFSSFHSAFQHSFPALPHSLPHFFFFTILQLCLYFMAAIFKDSGTCLYFPFFSQAITR